MGDNLRAQREGLQEDPCEDTPGGHRQRWKVESLPGTT